MTEKQGQAESDLELPRGSSWIAQGPTEFFNWDLLDLCDRLRRKAGTARKLTFV